MKKKLILLPLLMLALGACGSSVTPSSSASSQIPTSEAPTLDENVYRLTGSFYDPGWAPDSEFVMTRVGTENKFVYEALDLFADEEWAITINGDWAGQIGFTGTTNLTVVDSATTMGLGGGPGTVKNFKVLTDGNYDIELNTGVSPRTVTITRNGPAIDVPVVEVDPEEWHLVGTMNGWDPLDLSFPLNYDAAREVYSATYELDAGDKFKIASAATGFGWTLSRNFDHVDIDSPVPEWLDTNSDNDRNIILLADGTYRIDFLWIASVNATVNGVITIAKLADAPINVPGRNPLADKEVADVVNVAAGYVFYNLGTAQVAGVATPEGTFSINYYVFRPLIGGSGTDKDDPNPTSDPALYALYTGLVKGDFISFSGAVAISTGGDPARAKHLVPSNGFKLGLGTWEPAEFLSARTVDMETEFKDWATALATNDFGVVYTFTNVKFMSVGTATPTNTTYDYLNWSARVVGKNDIGTGTNYLRLGIYHQTVTKTVDEVDITTSGTYTIVAFMVGTNQNLPFSGTTNPILRLSGHIVVTAQAPAV